MTEVDGFAEQALQSYKELKDPFGVSLSLFLLALAAGTQGDFSRAHTLHKESLLMRYQSRDKIGMINSLEGLASLMHHDRVLFAVQLWAAAEVARAAIGFARPPRSVKHYTRELADAKKTLGEEAFAAAWAKGQKLGLEEAVAQVLEDKVQQGSG